MSEIDLDDALAGLEDSLGDDAGGGDETAQAGDSSGGGDKINLDDELQDALSGSDAPSGGDDGGEEEGFDLDAELNALKEEGGVDATEEAAPAAAPAPVLSAANIPGVADDSVNIEFLLDVKLHLTFEVGRSKMLISDLLTLGQGSVIELHRLVGDELDLLINGKLVANGEVVVVNEKFGCRITNIVPPEDRVKYLGEI